MLGCSEQDNEPYGSDILRTLSHWQLLMNDFTPHSCIKCQDYKNSDNDNERPRHDARGISSYLI